MQFVTWYRRATPAAGAVVAGAYDAVMGAPSPAASDGSGPGGTALAAFVLSVALGLKPGAPEVVAALLAARAHVAAVHIDGLQGQELACGRRFPAS